MLEPSSSHLAAPIELQHLSAEQDITILGKSHEQFEAAPDGPLVANVLETESLTAG